MRRALIASAFLLAALTGVPAMAQETTTETTNKTAIQQAFDAWRDRTGSPFDLLAEEATWTITGNSAAAGTYASKAEFMAKVIAPFNGRLSVGIRPTIRSLYADGDTVIAFFDAEGLAKDRKPYINTYAWFMRMKDGRIVEVSAFYDSIAFDDLWRRVQPN
ncbi:MAG: ketosteroid isomerase [Caulobacterales bacterium 68-7]|nr:MAG: ketosteroid isomerase [Caulobacterales bacterium 68-7]